ncbi:MAG: bifunctional 2-polyprenyl-6-hydroxyphenol methylase/3-demethylubiquinol 3-O-methyltransferase UbiG [Gammaproteobacteria bacterium]|nr:bifunctional 2-polyprenyl-6-hydroxyphenol methylase/3-demethylubiquinol 3-O-methyltransferase UbiG [Gammaproteobacteria bacterium]MCD8543225.1 bifunctional 2-polyprenyl-6-hydroxyphenol methylase/3-demethylubiquinol 3-O-methyltransferase UbiG [Gammaproteobacteria bacterium]
MKKNIDYNELNTFAQEAAYWWDPRGPLKSLHDINPLRLKFIRENIDLSKTIDILDVGCGGGILSESLADTNARVTGLDANDALIQVAILHAAEKNISATYVTSTLEDFEKQHPTQKFDVITCMELLEHVPDPAQLIKAASNMLKKNGKIFFSTINRTPQAFLSALLIGEHVLKLLPKGTHEYKKFIRPSELQQWCLEANITFKKMVGMGYNPLTKTYYVSDNIKVNYLVYAERDSF